jgi:LmbE family N-acetylglucosaminyl deacetylase
MTRTPEPAEAAPGRDAVWDIYLFAHPDDDIFARPLFRLDPGVRKAVVFLTSGWKEGLTSAATRRAEAQLALKDVGVGDIFWLGIESGIETEALAANLARADQSLTDLVARLGQVRRVLTHAWEGGHPDHDAAHLLGLALAKRLGVLPASIAIPCYRAPRSGPAPFVVMRPLTENGAVQTLRLTTAQAFSIVAGVRRYPSQLTSWIGLGPGLLLQALGRRELSLQALGDSTAPRRPVASRLLSESRFRTSYSDFAKAAEAFLGAASR